MKINRPWMLRLAPALFVLALAFTPIVASADTPNKAQPDSSSQSDAASRAELDRQVRLWISDLATEKPFDSWKTGKLTYEALGPGTHGWLVTIRNSSGQAAGYLIAYAAPDGTFRLGEYGTGPQPLFDKSTLQRVLLANHYISSKSPNSYTAVKHYVHPFAAVWEVKLAKRTFWFDAKTGEELPLDNATWAKIERTEWSPSSQIIAENGLVHLNDTFDPYERLPWLGKEQPLAADRYKLTDRLKAKGHLRFISQPFGDQMLYALPVVGYQQWRDGQVDLAVDNEGLRFIALNDLSQLGLFYR